MTLKVVSLSTDIDGALQASIQVHVKLRTQTAIIGCILL
uniref:Uncharacterized protein n=1 Tax=Nelumbo nucifera TaxID=4432 RepID=A0A822YJ73_NELNU|nr:TPA_asm: hypothetical protein HUJ06_011393 [Nelumbo nucifera]